MSTQITVDRAGRVVLPKPVRDKMRLTPGSTLELECEGEHITLRAVRPQAALHKEFGIWVFQGASTDESIPDLLQESREKRMRELKG
jgi:AbrB family looped-hinge helix DNA binding protein